jgi:hypothetical protein
MFENPIFSKAEKFVNPTTVPTEKVLTIYSDDPRNNEMYKKTCGMTIVVLEKPNNEYLENEISDSIFESEVTDISAPFKGDISVVAETNGDGSIALGIPQNLSIDLENGVFVELNTTDGTVSWTAVLNFDDVLGATTYEYSLVAI